MPRLDPEHRTYEGKLQMGLTSVSHGDDYIHITVEHPRSSTQVIDVRIGLEQFARALNGAYMDCVFASHAEHVDDRRENKEETVYVHDYSPDDEEIERVLAPYEVNGWMAYRDDLKNHHRIVSHGSGIRIAYRVSFFRWVRAETPEVPA